METTISKGYLKVGMGLCRGYALVDYLIPGAFKELHLRSTHSLWPTGASCIFAHALKGNWDRSAFCSQVCEHAGLTAHDGDGGARQ